METNVEMNPIYVLRMTRVEAAKMLVEPREAQLAVRSLLDPDGERTGRLGGALTGGAVKALPAGRVPQVKSQKAKGKSGKALRKGGLKAKRLGMRAFRARGPRPKVQCPYCDDTIADTQMGKHVAGAHPGKPWPAPQGGFALGTAGNAAGVAPALEVAIA